MFMYLLARVLAHAYTSSEYLFTVSTTAAQYPAEGITDIAEEGCQQDEPGVRSPFVISDVRSGREEELQLIRPTLIVDLYADSLRDVPVTSLGGPIGACSAACGKGGWVVSAGCAWLSKPYTSSGFLQAMWLCSLLSSSIYGGWL